MAPQILTNHGVVCRNGFAVSTYVSTYALLPGHRAPCS